MNKILRTGLNDLEQYSRLKNIRIFGLKDSDKNELAYQTEQKVLLLFRNKMGCNIEPRDIEAAHRVGRFSADANRPVIVRFLSRKTKSFNNK